jgi:hypothetical protein
MLLAAKHLDPIIGVDIHLIITPTGVTVPIPHPFLGFVFDVMDLIPIKIPMPMPDVQAAMEATPMADEGDFAGQAAAAGSFAKALVKSFSIQWVPLNASVKVNGMCRAQAGTEAVNMPFHIPIGGVFAKKPGFEGEMFKGSKTVLADGEPFSYSFSFRNNLQRHRSAPAHQNEKDGTPEPAESGYSCLFR